MAEVALVKTRGVLLPADEQTEGLVERLHAGEVLHGDFRKMRNPAFHRKFFAMLQVGFDAWEPEMAEPDPRYGLPAKDFEQFRRQVVVLAGFYDTVYSLDGSFRLVPKSISFASMDDDEFAQVYSKVADVILQRVLTHYSRDDLDEQVEKVLGFV